MEASMLTSLHLSAGGWLLMLVGSVFLGALLLMGVVRLTEGFSLSLWIATKITCVALFAVVAFQVVVTLVLMLFKVSPTTFMWTSSIVTLLGSLAVYVWIYGAWVKLPTGEAIGIGRAMKVTLVQTALQLVVLIGVAVVLAVLVAQGVIKMPTLPG